MKDNEFRKSEEVIPRRGLSSFSAPSSLTSLNTTASSEKKVFAESPSPEVRLRMKSICVYFLPFTLETLKSNLLAVKIFCKKCRSGEKRHFQ